MQLNRKYWNAKVPDSWKGYRESLQACINPFHYLPLVDPKKSPTSGTCNCSSKATKSTRKKRRIDTKSNRSIKEWVNTQRNDTHVVNYRDSGLDFKHTDKSNNRVTTMSNIVCQEHDRSKKHRDDEKNTVT